MILKHFLFNVKLLLQPNLKKALRNRLTYDKSKKTFLDTVDFSKKQKVLYTCITGGYENLLLPTYYNPEYDYICFTDTPELLKDKHFGPWQIRELVKDFGNPVMNNRWHKMMPHVIFSNYSSSIYIDGNLDILDDYIFRTIDERNNEIILIPNHYIKNCVYQEIKSFKKVYSEKKELLDKLITLEKKYQHEGMPRKYGLNENNLIYRIHNEEVASLMEEWWLLFTTYVPRDQLYFSYILWKHSILPHDIALPNCRINSNHFSFYYSNRHM